MIYYINYNKSQENNAGNKAPDDIAQICQELHYKEFSVSALPKGSSPIKIKLWILRNAPIWWNRLKKILTENDTVIYQHPMYGNRLAVRKIKEIKATTGCKFIAIIHDLESLRNGVDGEYKVKESTSNIADNQLLKLFDKIICHNESMIKYLVGKGIKEEVLINLEIFDYLSDTPIKKQKHDLSRPKIIVAGNLNWGKSRYIYEFGSLANKSSKLQINAYGNHFDQSKAEKALCYKGSFHPDVLPGILEGDFGLVWDGISAQSCIGNTGEYLKYNDPHKTSLYIASGIPVIVWKEAAISGFIKQNNIGIVVDSLFDVEREIEKISDDDYNQMVKNTILIGNRLRDGYYTKKALKLACGSEKDEFGRPEDKNSKQQGFKKTYYTLKKIKDKRVFENKFLFHGIVKKRGKDLEKLCIVLAGYKEFLYDSVFQRIECFATEDIDVCVISSGLFSDALDKLCERNNWTYISTKENNVCLVQNIAVKEHPMAKYIFKLDEDIFITKGYFEKMFQALEYIKKGPYNAGVIAPLIPVNGYGHVRILDKLGLSEQYEQLFEKPIFAAGSDRMIENNPEVAMFFWGKGDYIPSIDQLNAKFEAEQNTIRPCPIRFSIGAILYERTLIEDMGFFPVERATSGMAQDEIELCSYCCLKSRPIMVTENVVVGHFSFGLQTNKMKEFLSAHKERFSLNKESHNQPLTT